MDNTPDTTLADAFDVTNAFLLSVLDDLKVIQDESDQFRTALAAKIAAISDRFPDTGRNGQVYQCVQSMAQTSSYPNYQLMTLRQQFQLDPAPNSTPASPTPTS